MDAAADALGLALGGTRSQAYSSDETEFSFLEIIKALIEQQGYNELACIDSHLQFLSSLKKKLELVAAGEAHAGVYNWAVRQQASEIGEVMRRLRQVRRGFFRFSQFRKADTKQHRRPIGRATLQ